MLAEFAEILEVDLSNDQARFQGFAKVKIRLHLGKDLPKLRFFAYAKIVYPIRFIWVWDIYSPPISTWGTPTMPFSMGAYSSRGSQKMFGNTFRGNRGWRGGQGTNSGANVWTKSSVGSRKGGRGQGYIPATRVYYLTLGLDTSLTIIQLVTPVNQLSLLSVKYPILLV